jgi:uroporphyrinogen III methyltransferase / synthase
MPDDTRVWLVGAGPGDPGLITLRGLELLRAADVVLYDALAHPALLEECRDGALLVSVGKRYGAHSVEQPEIIRMLIEHARAGRSVVRLKGGDPLLFARGAEEAQALTEASIRFGVVPGICSPMGASTYAGVPLTHRDLSSSVTFVTGTDKFGKPHESTEWHRLAWAADTLCILMGMRRIDEITAALIEGGRPGSTPTCVIEWGARAEQRVLVSSLSSIAKEVAEQGYKNPAVIVVGDVVTLREQLRWFDNRPLFGKRVLLARAAEQALMTAQLVRQRGAEPVCFPLISIEDPEDETAVDSAVNRLSKYDWVLLTSANGSERLLRGLERCGLDARAFGGARIAVIGPKTAEPLKRFGLRPDLIAKDHLAEGLLRELLTQEPLRRVLLFRAAEAREVLPDELRARGVEVDVVAAYRTRRLGEAQAAPLRQSIERRSVDTVLVTSSSMALALVEGLGPQARNLLADLLVASIGPITSETLVQLGITPDVTASEHTIPGLLDALESHIVAHGSAKAMVG